MERGRLAMSVIATGQISIIDHNDALSLTAYINSDKTKTQMYNPDNGSYTPDWTKEVVTLSPSLFILGSADNIIGSAAVKSIDWYDVSDSVRVKISAGNGYTLLSNGRLRINANVMAGKTGKDYMAHIVYHDDSTKLDLPIETGITFSRVVNGSGIADAIAWLPDGNVFKNDSVSKLTAQCDFWRGSLVDTTDVTYQWYINSSAQTTDVGGGVGWRKLANKANESTGVTTSTLTVFPNLVTNYAVFKCVIIDNDPTSNSYKKEFVDTATIADQSDPIQCSVVSSGGTVFKNGDGQTTLTARLYRAEGEVDEAGTKYTYKWYKYNKDGTLVLKWGGTVDYKTGKSISVGTSDVETKGTFIVEVE